jgi:DNA-binding NarL/FixJ family response regulator
VHTAKFHVTAILEKLGARNRADAVSIILREGLVAI